MVTDPVLLFADEPTTGLDAFNARNLVQTFAAIAKTGRTVRLKPLSPTRTLEP